MQADRRWKLARGARTVELAGARLTALTLCWLAAHRRICALVLGGKRLSVLVLWDPAGEAETGYGDDDVAAIYQLVYGEPLPPDAQEAGT